MMTELLYPTHCTTYEGGTWRELPEGYSVSKEEIERERPSPGRGKGTDPCYAISFRVRFNGWNYRVHSISFGDPMQLKSLLNPSHMQCDEINGIR